MRRGPRLGEILLGAGLVDEEQLGAARERQARAGGTLLYNLVQGGAVSESALVRALARAHRLPVVGLKGKRVDPEVLALVPRELAEKFGCLPLFAKAEAGMRTLYLGVEDPTDQATVDDISFRLGLRVRPVVVGPVELRRALAAFHSVPDGAGAQGGSRLPEAPLAEGDTAPMIDPSAARTAADSEGEVASEAEEAADARPRDVPTRSILRAVVGILIEKGILTRAELMAAVREAHGGPSDEVG